MKDIPLNKQKVLFRRANITPTKNGQFVTIWKRNEKGITAPFDLSDDIDLFIIEVKKEDASGVFIFPKNVLNEQDIVSGNGKAGKRGIRVYPPWDITTSKQATRTQQWQLKYFKAFTEAEIAHFMLP